MSGTFVNSAPRPFGSSGLTVGPFSVGLWRFGSLRTLDVHLDRNDVYDVIEASEGVPVP